MKIKDALKIIHAHERVGHPLPDAFWIAREDAEELVTELLSLSRHPEDQSTSSIALALRSGYAKIHGVNFRWNPAS